MVAARAGQLGKVGSYTGSWVVLMQERQRAPGPGRHSRGQDTAQGGSGGLAWSLQARLMESLVERGLLIQQTKGTASLEVEAKLYPSHWCNGG